MSFLSFRIIVCSFFLRLFFTFNDELLCNYDQPRESQKEELHELVWVLSFAKEFFFEVIFLFCYNISTSIKLMRDRVSDTYEKSV